MSFYFRYRPPRFGTSLLDEFYFRLLEIQNLLISFWMCLCSPHFSSSSFVTSYFLEWSVSGLHHWFGKTSPMHIIGHTKQAYEWMNEAQSCKLSDFIFQTKYCYFLTWKNWFCLIQTFYEERNGPNWSDLWASQKISQQISVVGSSR